MKKMCGGWCMKSSSRFGRIDALINDAGIVPHFNWGIPRWPRARFMSKDFWDSVIQTNLGGTFLCTKYVVPFMEQRHSGNIVNLWGGGRAENHGAAAYVVSKDAIRTFTRFVAEEEREWNVCVVAFSPKQAIATEDAPEEARKRLPGPEILGNGFVLAAQAGMELTGKTVEHQQRQISCSGLIPVRHFKLIQRSRRDPKIKTYEDPQLWIESVTQGVPENVESENS